MLLLFDYDGVIADSFDFLLEVCVEAQAVFGQGREPSANDFRTIENLTFDELGGMIGIPEGKCAEYGAKVFEIQRKRECPCPFPGVVEVMIGDTIGDIRAGKRAGVQTVAVTWGFQARDLLVRESPDYLVDRPEEILAIASGHMRRGQIDRNSRL